MVSPELMGKRQVEAHGVGGDLIAQGRELLGKSFGLLVADGSVERRNHVEQAGLAGGVGQLDQRESGSNADEVRRGVAGFSLGPTSSIGLPLNVTSPSAIPGHLSLTRPDSPILTLRS
jgi:hypothetical protein